MKNVIILHGCPGKEEYYDPKASSASNAHWLPWLQAQLLKHEISASTPEVPHSYDCNWETWKREVEHFDIGPETILVGHSAGSGFWVKYLSINRDLKVDKVVLVAPWLDLDRDRTKNFFDDFEIDPNLVDRTAGITIFNSDNDQESVQKTTRLIRGKVKGVNYREFHNYGHFCFKDMRSMEFPELLSVLIG